MTHLVKIGNSHGIRIPKPLIEQAQLEGTELSLKVVKDGILISPHRNTREGWKESIEAIINTSGQESIDSEWLDASLVTDEDIEW